MSGQAGSPASRWWRRGRDAALADAVGDAQQAREAAAAAMLELDAELSGLSVDVAAHEDAGSARGAGHHSPGPDPLVQNWRNLSSRTDAAIGHYLSALAQHDPAYLVDVPRARQARAELDQAAARLRDVLPQVRRFKQQYERPLGIARGARTLAPRRIAEATAAVTRAREAVAAAGTQVTDPGLGRALDEAQRAAETAQRAMAEGRLAAAGAAAESARAGADAVTTRAQTLAARAADVRRGAASVHTRREALRTRHERLAPVMSELRRRYTHGAWAGVEQAPQRAAQALAEVDDVLGRLDGLLAAPVLDVPAAAALLDHVRGAAARAEQAIRSATDRLAQLDAASSDPGAVLGAVEHELVDARRFLAALPEGRGQRYRSTFDNLARRLQALQQEVRAPRPDWGHVVDEARSVTAGLDAMIRTARAG